MDTSTALVVATAEAVDPSDTPLGAFYSELARRRRFSGSSTTMAGAARWTGFPVDEAIASGMFVVLTAAARRLQLPLLTPTQVKAVADRVDLLLNVGLALVYGNALTAADAFEVKVATAMATAARQRYVADESSPANTLWQTLAAQFFAELVRAAVRLGEQARQAIDELEQRSVLYSDRKRYWLYEVDSVTFRQVADCLRWEAEPHGQKPDLVARSVSLLKDIAAIRSHLVFVALLPIRWGEITDELWRDHLVGVADIWVNTQLLRLAANLPEAEFIDVDGYRLGYAALSGLSDEEVVNRFQAFVNGRAPELDAKALTYLTEYARQCLQKVRSWPAIIGLGQHEQLFIVMAAHEEHTSEDQAMDIACGRMLLPGMNQKFLRTRVLDVIDWRKLELGVLAEMEASGPLDSGLLVEGVARMDEADRREAVEVLLAGRHVSQMLITALCRADLTPGTAGFVEKYGALIPPSDLVKIARELLDANVMTTRALITVTNRIKPAALTQLLDEPRYRRQWLDRVIEMYVDTWVQRREGITSVEAGLIRRRFGPHRFARFVLAYEVSIRSEEYRQPWENKNDFRPRWLDQAARPQGALALRDILQVTRQRLRRVLEEHPEDEVFKWLNADEPDVEARLAAYRADRERYYAPRP